VVLVLGASAELEHTRRVTFSAHEGISHRPIHRLVMTDIGKQKEFLAVLVAFKQAPPEIGLEWDAGSETASIRVGELVQEVIIRGLQP